MGQNPAIVTPWSSNTSKAKYAPSACWGKTHRVVHTINQTQPNPTANPTRSNPTQLPPGTCFGTLLSSLEPAQRFQPGTKRYPQHHTVCGIDTEL